MPSQPNNKRKGQELRWKVISPILLVFALTSVCLPAEKVDTVVAVVNDEIITSTEVRQLIEPIVAELKKKYKGAELERMIARQWREALDRLIDKKLLAQEGRKALERHEIESALVEQTVDSIVKDLIDKAGSLLQLKKMLAKTGETLEERRERTRESLLIEAMIRRNVDAWVHVSPKEVRDYYRRHIKDYTREKEVKTRHIFIPFSQYESKEKARKLAELVMEKLKKGASFESLAKQYSSGAHAKEGGLWDFMKRPAFKDLDDVIFNLKAGEVSGIVETSRGYHIVKAEAVRPARRIPFEEVQDEIYNKLYTERRAKRYREYLKKLREKAYIEIR